MPKLVIKRAKDFSNVTKKFTLLIDGKEVGGIAHGGSEAYDVPAGNHVVKAKVQWFTSKEYEVTVNEHETKYLKVSGNRSNIIISIAALVIMLACIVMKDKLGENGIFYVLVPLLLYRVYQFTLGRNNYLKIKEDEFYK